MANKSFKPCPICREQHDPARSLSWDGKGVNDCSMYRSRIATVSPDYRFLGPTMAASVELLAACKVLIEALESERKANSNGALVHGGEAAINLGYRIIAKAEIR